MDEKTIARFWTHVERRGQDECWVWKSALGPKGYGQFWPQWRSPVGAHRASWLIHNGPVAAGLQVCHRCDNPPCVNPAHLFLGTMGDNMRDKVSKGRQSRGEGRPNAKLTEDSVRALRAEYAGGETSLSRLAAKYGVIVHTVWCAVRRTTWKHVD